MSRGLQIMLSSPEQMMRCSEIEVVALVDDIDVMDTCPIGLNK